MKAAMLCLGMLTLAGCAGLSPEATAERDALRDYHVAEARVDRKEVKVGLATATAAVAASGVIKATAELSKATQERDKAKAELMELLK